MPQRSLHCCLGATGVLPPQHRALLSQPMSWPCFAHARTNPWSPNQAIQPSSHHHPPAPRDKSKGKGWRQQNWARVWADLAPPGARTHIQPLPSRSAPSPGSSPCSKCQFHVCTMQGSGSRGKSGVGQPDAVQDLPQIQLKGSLGARAARQGRSCCAASGLHPCAASMRRHGGLRARRGDLEMTETRVSTTSLVCNVVLASKPAPARGFSQLPGRAGSTGFSAATGLSSAAPCVQLWLPGDVVPLPSSLVQHFGSLNRGISWLKSLQKTQRCCPLQLSPARMAWGLHNTSVQQWVLQTG